MHLPTRIFLLRMIDELVHVAFHRPIAARRVGVEPTARVHGQVGGFLHRLYREISGRVQDDGPLAADPRNNRGPVFVIMASARLTLLAAPTGAAPQRLRPALFGLALVASGM